jgi:hypothetical protein
MRLSWFHGLSGTRFLRASSERPTACHLGKAIVLQADLLKYKPKRCFMLQSSILQTADLLTFFLKWQSFQKIYFPKQISKLISIIFPEIFFGNFL